MSTYTQWVKTFEGNSLSRIYYVHGDVSPLVEEAVDKIRGKVDPSPIDSFSFLPSESKDVWAAAFTYPIDPEANRLIVVRQAQEFSDWKLLHSWLINRHPNCYLLFVSDEKEIEPLYVKGRSTGYAQHIEIIKSRGKMIKCVQPSDEDLSDYLTERGFSKLQAKYLIERSSGDVYEILNTVRKIQVFDAKPERQLIDLLVEEKALDSFVDYLIVRDKKAAFLAAKSLSDKDLKTLVKRLDRKLDFLYDLGICVRKKLFVPEIVDKLGVSAYSVRMYSPIAKNYDAKKILSCRQALAAVDADLSIGNRKAVLESLIALW